MGCTVREYFERSLVPVLQLRQCEPSARIGRDFRDVGTQYFERLVSVAAPSYAARASDQVLAAAFTAAYTAWRLLWCRSILASRDGSDTEVSWAMGSAADSDGGREEKDHSVLVFDQLNVLWKRRARGIK